MLSQKDQAVDTWTLLQVSQIGCWLYMLEIVRQTIGTGQIRVFSITCLNIC